MVDKWWTVKDVEKNKSLDDDRFGLFFFPFIPEFDYVHGIVTTRPNYSGCNDTFRYCWHVISLVSADMDWRGAKWM